MQPTTAQAASLTLAFLASRNALAFYSDAATTHWVEKQGDTYVYYCDLEDPGTATEMSRHATGTEAVQAMNEQIVIDQTDGTSIDEAALKHVLASMRQLHFDWVK